MKGAGKDRIFANIMDNLVEQVVARKKDSKYRVKVIAVILVAVLVPVTFFVLGLTIPFPYLIYIALFSIPVMAYLSWFFISSFNVDYEYALLGSTLNVAKIIAKRKRRLQLQTDVRQFDDMFKYDDREMARRSFTKVFMFSREDYSENSYVACFQNDARGKCAMIFDPDEKMLAAMKPYLNYDIARKVYYGK